MNSEPADRRDKGRRASRALVLGGGGPLGIGWEAGLLAGLAAEGFALGDADAIIGTSAGAVVGAHLALGEDLFALSAAVNATRTSPTGSTADIQRLQAVASQAAATAPDHLASMAAIGSYALEADTLAEDSFLETGPFPGLADRGWPEPFRCTAIDTRTGQLRVFERSSGVALHRAAAASCAVPGIFPPITIQGSRYMDGGMSSPLNAQLATGYDHVLVISCFATELLESTPDAAQPAPPHEPTMNEPSARSASVLIVGPSDEFLDISQGGAAVMDSSRTVDAYHAGIRHARHQVQRLPAQWYRRPRH